MASLNFDPIYIFLNLLLLFVFYQSGVNVSKGRNYWLNAVNCIVAFTLVLGARYMRGNDYAYYLEVYKYDLLPEQRVYTIICDVMKFLGINEYCSFFIYALVFSLCLFVLLKRYRAYAKYLFPFSLMFLLFFHEFMIRQAFGYSFVFLYMDKLFSLNINNGLKALVSKKSLMNILWCVLFLIIALGIHSANVFVVIILTFAYLFLHRPVPWQISSSLLIVSTYYLSKNFDFGMLNPFLSYLGDTDSKFKNYTDNANMFFSADAMNDIYSRNHLVSFIDILANVSIFVLAPKIFEKYKRHYDVLTLYNCAVFGVIFQSLFFKLELLNRMGLVFRILMFFPLSIVFYNKKYFIGRTTYKIMYCLLFFFFYDYLKILLFKGENMTKFLWDI